MRWYLARLSAMSPREVLHRVREQGERRRLARFSGGWAGVEAAVAEAGLTTRSLAALRAALAQCPGPASPAPFMALGRRWLPGSGPGGVFAGKDWFFDPVSGRCWPGPDSDPFSIDVRSTSAHPRPERPFGDAKFVWEVNRLQMLHPLAAQIAREGAGGEAFLEATAWIDAWMDANPPYRGVNWSQGIEIALRAVSVALVVGAAGPGNLAAPQRRRLAAFFQAHGQWLAALPSLHSSANNHRVAEGLGLFVCGAMVEGEAGREWLGEGRAILQREALLQILPDGVGVEQSPTYQAFTMEMIALGALLARMSGAPFEPRVLARLQAGVRFLRALQDRSGAVPAIGDDDEGRVVTRPGRGEPLYVASVAAAVGDLCGVACARAARPGYFREGLFAAMGSVGDVEPARELAREPAQMLCFPDGGYTVMNEPVAGRSVHLVFDHGPLGYGPLAAHGHADALAIWLSIDDRPVFVDAGTYLYHSGEDLRLRLRESQTHNTLTIAGHSQSVPSSAFSWSSRAEARVLARDGKRAGTALAAGAHDGYVRRFGVRHERALWFEAGGLTIADRLRGRAGASDVEISFLCAPDIEAHVEDGSVLLFANGAGRRDAVLRMRVPQGFAIERIRGDASSGRGLTSPAFGALVETVQIVLKGRLAHADEGCDPVAITRLVLEPAA